jgi:small subunit ribosomal protein S6
MLKARDTGVPISVQRKGACRVGTYEIVAVLRADLDEEGLSAALDRISQRITEHGGSVTGVDRWGKRRLAYPIKKQRDGFYALIVFTLAAGRIPALRQTLGLHEDLLRLAFSRHHPKPEPAPARAPAAAAAIPPAAPPVPVPAAEGAPAPSVDTPHV